MMPMYRIRTNTKPIVKSQVMSQVKSPIKLTTMTFMSKGVKSCRSCR